MSDLTPDEVLHSVADCEGANNWLNAKGEWVVTLGDLARQLLAAREALFEMLDHDDDTPRELARACLPECLEESDKRDQCPTCGSFDPSTFIAECIVACDDLNDILVPWPPCQDPWHGVAVDLKEESK